MSSSIWFSVRFSSGMPRYLPSTFSVGEAYIGFIAGALRIHERRFGLVEALRCDALQVQRTELLRGGVVQALACTPAVSRSNVAPANVVRVIRLVRFGAAPETMYSSGLDSTGTVTPLVVTVRPLTWWQREHWEMNVD